MATQVKLRRGNDLRRAFQRPSADAKRAALIAGDRAWLPYKRWSGMRVRLAKLLGMFGGGVPKQVRQRYGRELRSGKVVVIAAAGGQPADTIAALFEQVRGEHVDQWWQKPSHLFAPPELAGPF